MDPTAYRARAATLADADVLVRHRLEMFSDMGITFDRDRLAAAFRGWLDDVMPAGVYRAWVIEDAENGVVSGGGISVIPWPPGPRYFGNRLAFVYNVYTEPAFRGRGLARLVMAAIHDWCRAEGISSLALNASTFGKPLYDSLGYVVTPSPMMFFALE
jgi:GNAT superfamily N-acetyltransferase